MAASFTLTEPFAFGSRYSWRLKESEIRFRGSGEYQRLVLQRIPVSVEQIASFHAALDLIQVWEWRNDYKPDDIGCAVDDGSWWSFAASFEGQDCRCIEGVIAHFESDGRSLPEPKVKPLLRQLRRCARIS